MLNTPDLRGHTVLALHAHPDDEAIFTGITLRRLADAGARIVLVLATAGELGESRVPLAPGETVAHRRITELERSAELLGVTRLVLLGRRDSGLPGWRSGAHPMAMAGADHRELARRIAAMAESESAQTLIYDDADGIYGHPDHRVAHVVGAAAARLTGADSYRITVDRDHLDASVPGRHLVHGAADAAAVRYGRAAAEITLAVPGSPTHLADKYAAITAHASQVDPAWLPADDFASAYGTEWYRHRGAPGLLHLLSATPPAAAASTGVRVRAAVAAVR
ncbi:MAG TPA: PIG-L family deacetylase [Pseudonocardia sp.]|jgi:LmbE family N-acetylglucosaminyl deacetylase|uniref:PIG-L deacetylase family protein n=1 Tax=Pseudonocardia sp. TaxID=60912 RepID=UPI002F415019